MPKIVVSFQMPDAVSYAMDNEYKDRIENEEDEIEKEKLIEEKTELESFIEKFVRWGELVSIEFDSDNKTATVL